MAINIRLQYNGELLTDIILLTQAPIVVWLDDTIIVVYYHYPFNYVLQYCLLFCFVWWSRMAIDIRVQYNDGLLPDIILLTQCYYDRGKQCFGEIKNGVF